MIIIDTHEKQGLKVDVYVRLEHTICHSLKQTCYSRISPHRRKHRRSEQFDSRCVVASMNCIQHRVRNHASA